MSNALNPKVSMDQLVLKSLYYRYKIFLVPVGTIGVCLLLFLYLIIPQIQSWMAMKDEVSGDSQKLATLKQNLDTITKLDDNKLDTYLQTASSALPAEKDFAGVLQAISTAAANAGSALGDYNFQIGDLDASGGKVAQSQLPLELAITLKGDLTTARVFIEELKKQLPLSDVSSVSVNSNNTISVAVVFYYAPLPKINFDDSVPLTTLSKKDEEVLQLLQVTEGGDSSTAPQASPTPGVVTVDATVTPTPAPKVSPTPVASQSAGVTP